MTGTNNLIVTNARIVLADAELFGWLAVEDGVIADFGEGPAPAGGLDLGGDYLIPGLIELHTDHLESHFQPRPKVHWNAVSAVLSYDAQIATSGITTVFDSLRIGAASDTDNSALAVYELAAALQIAREQDLLRAEHKTHLRCEIATPNVVPDLESYLAERPVHLISMMDHTPGQRQFRDMTKMRSYYVRHGFVGDDHFAQFVEQRKLMHGQYAAVNRRAIVELAHRAGAALASHDDESVDQVEEAVADRVAIAEFPTTIEAAAASHAADIRVLMGAPNIVRGGSHSGNVAAADLAGLGILDILSSDYVPASLLMAAFELPKVTPRFDLPSAIRLVTKNPAEATGLADRGEIAVGLRADLVQVAAHAQVPAVRQVWRAGRRVA